MINPNARYQCDGAIRFKMHSDAPSDEKLIEFADQLSQSHYGDILDSLDLGDSMGLFMRIAYDEYMKGELFTILPSAEGFAVEVEVDIDLFEWHQRPDTPNS